MVRNYTSTIARDYSGDRDQPSVGEDWEKWKNNKIKQTNERRRQGIKSPFKILIPKNTLVIVKRYSDQDASLQFRNLNSVGLDLATETCEIIPYRFIYKHGIEIDGKVGNIKLGEVETTLYKTCRIQKILRLTTSPSRNSRICLRNPVPP